MPWHVARRQHRLGLLRQRQGKLPEAVELLTASAAGHEQVLGANHSSTANGLSDLAALHLAMGNHGEAQRCLRRSIRVHEQESGVNSPEAVADLTTLTESLEATGDIDGAAALWERVLGLKLREVGMNLDTVADEQWQVALRFIGWRRYARGRELLMEAVGIFKGSGGARLARGYETLAQLEEETGHYHEALRELARAAKVWESVKAEHRRRADPQFRTPCVSARPAAPAPRGEVFAGASGGPRAGERLGAGGLSLDSHAG